MVNGIDIVDPTRSFTQAEMDRLGPVGRAIMFQQREIKSPRGIRTRCQRRW
jgi:hypothetical protein